MSDNAFSELRGKLDGNDGFVSGGHRIMKTAGATRHAARMKRVPVWALDDYKIKQYIMTHFPKMGTDPEHRRLAGRVVRLIHLYYRVGVTTSSVAEELKVPITTVEKLIRKINKGMNNPLKGPGRPRKGVCIQQTSGESIPTEGRG